MNELTMNSDKRKSSIVLIIAGWMFAMSFWVIANNTQVGSLELFFASIQPVSVFYFYSIICAFGLIMFKPWAWKNTIFLFGLHALWGLYTVYLLVGIWGGHVVSRSLWGMEFDPQMWKVIVCALVLVYALWPILVILCLTHPQVKSRFSIVDKEFKDFKPTDTKPG